MQRPKLLKPSSLLKRPAADPPSQPAKRCATPSLSSEADHAAAIFGPATAKKVVVEEADRFLREMLGGELRPAEEGSSAAGGCSSAAGGCSSGETDPADDSPPPFWKTLATGDMCRARLDGKWCKSKVVGVVHQGYSNALFRVVPADTAPELLAAAATTASRFTAAAAAAPLWPPAPPPREVGVQDVRPASQPPPSAEKLARGLCIFYSAGNCTRGDKCKFAHVDLDEVPG